MITRVLNITLVSLLCLLAACTAPIPDDVDLAIVGATVIDVADGTSSANQTVLISGGRIVAIKGVAEVNPPPGATTIDANGKYLIPGLWDMHAHVLYPDPYDRYMPMLVANGVTSVRDMNTPMPMDEIRRVLQDAESDSTLIPRIITPLRLIDGPARSAGARGPEVRVANDTTEAREIVEKLATEGAEFIKVYNSLTPELLAAVIGAAHVG